MTDNQAVDPKVRKANAVALVVRTIGILFFLAMAFRVMPFWWALFLGVACMIIAPAIRQLILSRG